MSMDIEGLKRFIGSSLTGSEWFDVTQEMIDAFAKVTGDEQWIHVDVERSHRESPFGAPVAHGLLILSLIPKLTSEEAPPWFQGSVGINYGADRVRFISPVKAGSRIRAVQTLKSVEPYGPGARMTSLVVVEVEGGEKPACSAEMIGLIYP
ncbi:MAG: MaoC family dehydratase [Bordetella sp.]|nr:MaoC family dehydratase [Bordetella sp.]